MELNNRLKLVFGVINFCERYQSLSLENQFLNNDKTLEQEKVLELIKGFGYDVKFNKSESFYKIVQKQNKFKFQFNISLRQGNVELIWDVLENSERLNLGGPWGMIYKLVLNSEERPLMPKFRSIEDLEVIMKTAFSIYEDFKAELIKQEKSVS